VNQDELLNFDPPMYGWFLGGEMPEH
jgi:hypothetical protein